MEPKTKRILTNIAYIPVGLIVCVLCGFGAVNAQGAEMEANLPEDKDYYDAWQKIWIGAAIASALAPPAMLVRTLITN